MRPSAQRAEGPAVIRRPSLASHLHGFTAIRTAVAVLMSALGRAHLPLGTTAQDSGSPAMPRFHFDIHDGARFTMDETGEELDGLQAAREQAARRLEELAREILRDGDRRDVVIEVKDEVGQRVLIAKLSVSIEATELPGFSPVEEDIRAHSAPRRARFCASTSPPTAQGASTCEHFKAGPIWVP
jgi:hypothetical protein